MPLYLVRWPNLSAALVKAESEEDLIDKLDQVENPEGCTWKVYKGPLHIEFEIPVKVRMEGSEDPAKPLKPEDLHIEDMSGLDEGNPLHISFAGGDDGLETFVSILKGAFPHFYKLWQGDLLEASDAQVRNALKKELDAFVRGTWRWANVERRTDPAAVLAQQMRTSVANARRYLKQFGKPEGTPPRGKRK